jgi:Putative auto-transporter adhesin, head GIN domain
MRLPRTVGVLAVVAITASAAQAAPSLDIRGAAARVILIPEARSGFRVTVLTYNSRFPLRVRQFGDRLSIVGDVAHRTQGCPRIAGRPAVRIAGRGTIGLDSLPELVIHTPINVRVSAGEAVFGVIGRSDSLNFANRGCGDWTIANVRGRMRLNQAGAGFTRAGSAGSADLSVAGSGNIATREIDDGLIAVSSGSGDIEATSVSGLFNVRIAGSGEIRAAAGQVTLMTAAIAGSGSVRFAGVAETLHASVAGSGDVSVSKVSGPVVRRVFGSGAVRVGR